MLNRARPLGELSYSYRYVMKAPRESYLQNHPLFLPAGVGAVLCEPGANSRFGCGCADLKSGRDFIRFSCHRLPVSGFRSRRQGADRAPVHRAKVVPGDNRKTTRCSAKRWRTRWVKRSRRAAPVALGGFLPWRPKNRTIALAGLTISQSRKPFCKCELPHMSRPIPDRSCLRVG